MKGVLSEQCKGNAAEEAHVATDQIVNELASCPDCLDAVRGPVQEEADVTGRATMRHGCVVALARIAYDGLKTVGQVIEDGGGESECWEVRVFVAFWRSFAQECRCGNK